MSYRWKNTALALLLVGWASIWARPARGQNYFAEFFEEPGSMLRDDNDRKPENNDDQRIHPTGNLSGMTSSVIDDVGASNETPIRPLLGMRLRWGGYSSASGVTSPAGSHVIAIVNDEDAGGPGSRRNTFLLFSHLNSDASSDFPMNYDASNGSYVYSTFESIRGEVQSIDGNSGIFKIAVNNDDNNGTYGKPGDPAGPDAAARDQSFRLLIQIDDGINPKKWYLSGKLSSKNRNIFPDNPNTKDPFKAIFGGGNSDQLQQLQPTGDPDAKSRESLMTEHPLAAMTWERVTAAAEADMNSPDDGGEVELGVGDPADSPTSDELRFISGWGVVIDELTSGKVLALNSIRVLGMILQGVPTVRFADPAPAVDEVAEGMVTTVILTIDLSMYATVPTIVSYSTSDMTATAGKDYAAKSGSVTFGPNDLNERTFSFPIDILGDDIDEGDNVNDPEETFLVELMSEDATVIGSAVVTIIDTSDTPTIRIEASDAQEDAGSAMAVVSLSNPSAFQISVRYATMDGTATAGLDYTSDSGTLEFTPDSPIMEPVTSLPIPITILNDTLDEDDRETFFINLTDAQGPVVLDPDPLSVEIGILDDDDPPTVQLAAAMQTFVEPDSGMVFVPIEIVLSQASGRDYTVQFEVTPISAFSGVDYVATTDPPSSVTFAKGPSGGETTKTVMLELIPDTLDELNETLAFRLTSAITDNMAGDPGPVSDPPMNLIVDPRTQTITIDDDDPPPSISLSTAAETVQENIGVVTIEVCLSGVSAKFITVNIETLDGTAIAGIDYGAVQEQLVFAPGELCKSLDIPIEDDDFYGYLINDALAVEKDFTIRISNPLSLRGGTNTNPTLDIDLETITINENESIPSLAFATDSQIVVEGDDDAAHVDITVTGKTIVPITFSVSTMDDSATQPMDYIAEFGTRFIHPLEMTTEPIWIPIVNDPFTEGPEAFLVVLSNAAGAVIDPDGDAHTVTIMDDPEMDLLTKTIFCETWDNVAAPLGLQAGPVALSDEDFEALEGFSATPLDNVRFAIVGSSTRIQRIEFGADALGLSGSRAFGNSLRAPLATLEGGPLDDDRVNSITLEARVFIGALTPVGSADFPTTADLEVASLSTFTFVIGDSAGGDAMMTLPASLGSAGSIGFQLNNNEWGGGPGGGTSSRLIFTINDPTMGLAASLGVPTAPHSAFVAAPEGIGQALQATASAVFASSGEEYIIGATFIKLSFNRTDVEYYIQPVDGTANVSTNGVAGPISIPSSFPFNGVIDQAAINLGAGFGLGDGAEPGIPFSRDGDHQGSWVDDLKVRTFGIKSVQPLASSSWLLYE